MAVNSAENPNVQVLITVNAASMPPSLTFVTSVITDPPSQPNKHSQGVQMVTAGNVVFTLDEHSCAEKWRFPNTVQIQGTQVNFFGVAFNNWRSDMCDATYTETEVTIFTMCTVPSDFPYTVTVKKGKSTITSTDPTIKDRPV